MGIKLGEERRGFAVAQAVSGQAEAKGALAGDIILAIGGFLVVHEFDRFSFFFFRVLLLTNLSTHLGAVVASF